MSRCIKLLAAASLVLGIAACTKTYEEQFVVIEPLSSEPATIGKYK